MKLRLFISFFFLPIVIGKTRTSIWFNVDSRYVTWAHGVDSRSNLERELKSNKNNMLKTHVMIGVLSMSENREIPTYPIPVIAQPPSISSDISFEEFLQKVISDKNNKHGIKFDFKDINAVEPSLLILQANEKLINFPIWLHADILPGPVNCTNIGLNPKIFTDLTKKYYPKGTLSLGWTTHQETTKEPTLEGYTDMHINSMSNILDTLDLDDDDEIIIPMRAKFAVNSLDSISSFLIEDRKRFLTLWSYRDDKINPKKLNALTVALGGRIYNDLGHLKKPKSEDLQDEKSTDQFEELDVESICASPYLSMLLNLLVICFLVFITENR